MNSLFLEALLQSSECLEFIKFLEKEEQGLIKLEFLIVCRGLEVKWPTMTRTEQCDAVEIIYNIYVKEVKELSTGTKTQTVSNALYGLWTSNIFSDAQREIEEQIKNSYLKFVKYTEYISKDFAQRSRSRKELTTQRSSVLPEVGIKLYEYADLYHAVMDSNNLSNVPVPNDNSQAMEFKFDVTYIGTTSVQEQTTKPLLFPDNTTNLSELKRNMELLRFLAEFFTSFFYIFKKEVRRKAYDTFYSRNPTYLNPISCKETELKAGSTFAGKEQTIKTQYITGLENNGNTCYINAILQSLARIDKVAEYFLKLQENLKLLQRTTASKEKCYELTIKFGEIINDLRKGEVKSITSQSFIKNTLTKYMPISGQEEDAQEFLLTLINQLHNDLNQAECGEELKESNIFPCDVKNLFCGVLKSTVLCVTCKVTSDTYEEFVTLTLPIKSDNCRIEECISDFTTPELLSEENKVYCNYCKNIQAGTKTMVLTTCPEILILHLNRFEKTVDGPKKINHCVKYPLLLQHYKQKTYELNAIVNHRGSLERGHYTAICKSTDTWYEFNDSNVSQINLSQIKESDPYLFFYTAVEKS